jgi:secondary thiamine-phosphate synthase enzyme
MASSWVQRTVVISTQRGCNLITRELVAAVPELRSFHIGMANFFLQHTSASLSINENADPTVRVDMEEALNRIVPEAWHEGPDAFFEHTLEGADDMTGGLSAEWVSAFRLDGWEWLARL